MAIVPLVPAYLAIVWDAKGTAMGEGNFLHKHFLKYGNNFIFYFFWVHECERVVVLEHDVAGDGVGFGPTPDAEHGSIYYVG